MQMIDPIIIFDEFCSILGRWTEDAVTRNRLGLLSEDTLCSFLALSYFQLGVEAHRIEMEVPHPALHSATGARKDVDILIRGVDGLEWIEVKLDKKIRSGKIAKQDGPARELDKRHAPVGHIAEGKPACSTKFLGERDEVEAHVCLSAFYRDGTYEGLSPGIPENRKSGS